MAARRRHPLSPLGRWLGLAALLAAPAARADDPRPFPSASAKVEDGRVALRFDVGDVFDAELLERLKSGLTNDVYIAASLSAEGEPSRPAVAPLLRTCKIVFDLWEERFLVELTDPGGKRTEVRPAARAAAEACARVDLRLAPHEGWAPGLPHRLEAVVRVNPISEELEAKAKEHFRRAFEGPRSRGFLGSSLVLFFNPRSEDPEVRYAARLPRLDGGARP